MTFNMSHLGMCMVARGHFITTILTAGERGARHLPPPSGAAHAEFPRKERTNCMSY